MVRNAIRKTMVCMLSVRESSKIKEEDARGVRSVGSSSDRKQITGTTNKNARSRMEDAGKKEMC